jgi:hypothetical protein
MGLNNVQQEIIQKFRNLGRSAHSGKGALSGSGAYSARDAHSGKGAHSGSGAHLARVAHLASGVYSARGANILILLLIALNVCTVFTNTQSLSISMKINMLFPLDVLILRR